MKKKMLALVCAVTLVFGGAVSVSASDTIVSPSGTPDTTQTTDKSDTAPKTGESNMLLYGIAGALLLTGTAVVSKKQLEASK